MPKYVLVARDGREATSSRMYSHAEVLSYKRAPSCYTFVNELTNSVKNVGACRTRSGRLRDGVPTAVVAPAPVAAKPAVAPVAGWWPFNKKKPAAKAKVNPMSKRMLWEPGRPMQIFGRARKRRRR